MDDVTHDMREHTTLEEVIKAISNFEDPDSALVIQPDRNGNILAWQNFDYPRTPGQPTLLETLYIAFPECYCSFAEWKNNG